MLVEKLNINLLITQHNWCSVVSNWVVWIAGWLSGWLLVMLSQVVQ